MLKVNFNNLFQIYKFNRVSGLSVSDLEISVEDGVKYRQLLKSRQQGFVDLPYNTKLVTEIQAFAGANRHFKYFVILGIGGSMLGPKTIVDALCSENIKKRVICLDNIDPYLVESVEGRVDLAQTLFLVQTKSGGTPETIAQYLYFKDKVERANLKFQDHFVFVTDAQKGWLRQVATTEKVPSFEVPANVGGRFSVLSAIGLLVSALVGLDIEKLLLGAKELVEKEFDSASTGSALCLAKASYLLKSKGKTNVVIMPYSSRLQTFSDWCVQLISESTGKQYDLMGKEVFAGLTPISSLGATDQHSQLQLFNEGPNDKQIFFIEINNYQVKVPIPSAELKDNKELSYLSNQSFNSLIQAELEGTRQSLTESLRPNVTIAIDRVDEANLGALFMFFELYTAFLGEFLNIDTYNQPGVERSKVLTREILSR